jgi:hypothetical protein
MGVIETLGVWGRRNFTFLSHRMVIGAAGAITSQDSPADSGIVASLNGVANGQYTLALSGTGGAKGYRQFLGVWATILGPTGAGAFGAGGALGCMKDDNVDAGTRLGTVAYQFMDTAAPPIAAHVTSGYTVMFVCCVAA